MESADINRMLALATPIYDDSADIAIDQSYFEGQLSMYDAINAALATGDKARIEFLRDNARAKLAEIEEYYNGEV